MTAANDNSFTLPEQREPKTRPCPICGCPAAPDVRPFCSKRCADIDLHRWLGGHYAVPAEADEPPDGETET